MHGEGGRREGKPRHQQRLVEAVGPTAALLQIASRPPSNLQLIHLVMASSLEPVAGVAVLLLLVLLCGGCRGGAPPPAMYVFGDSLADVGNNNHLRFSLLRADFPHNGVDFAGRKATGRFSNGKNAADFFGTSYMLLDLKTITNSNSLP